MSQLPRSFSDALEDISVRDGKPAGVARGVAALLDAIERCGDLSRAVEAFREAARVLGILEESRNGQKVYDAWCKLTRFFLEPLEGLRDSLWGSSPDLGPAPSGFETLGNLWEKTSPELSAFIEEHKALNRVLQESPVSTHVGYRIRSRLMLLDRRAERLKVALDLFRRDVSQAARRGVIRVAELLKKNDGQGGSGRQASAGGQQ